MKTKITFELEGTKEEINNFAKGINSYVFHNKSVRLDVKPMGGYIPRFYLPHRKRSIKK